MSTASAELLKRSLFATITYGNKKGIDIFAIGENRRVAVVEVKASNSSRFVTSLFQKYPDPDMARTPIFGCCIRSERTSQGLKRNFSS